MNTQPTDKQLAALDPLIVLAAEAHAAVRNAENDKERERLEKRREHDLKFLLSACVIAGIKNPEASVLASVVGTAANLSEHGKGARSAYAAVANGKFLYDCLQFHAARRRG